MRTFGPRWFKDDSLIAEYSDHFGQAVTRQKQTETEGLKVPVIYESSPYYAGTSGPRQFLWDVKQEVGAEPPKRTSQPRRNSMRP